MPVWAMLRDKPRVLYEDHSLVATGAPVNSGFLKLNKTTVTMTKTHTTGTYQIDIAWSMDGTNTAFTETNILTANNTPVTKTALAPWAKFTITATVSNFTVHQTTVMI